MNYPAILVSGLCALIRVAKLRNCLPASDFSIIENVLNVQQFAPGVDGGGGGEVEQRGGGGDEALN